MHRFTRYMLFGAPVDAVDMPAALGCVEECIASGLGPASIFAVNPEKVNTVRSSRFLQHVLWSATLLVPDGIGVVLAIRLLLSRSVPRVTGADLMDRICARAAARGYRIFIYGAAEEVNRAAVATLRRRYPGIVIAGRAHGYTRPEAMDRLIQDVNSLRVDILFVALGSPRQEEWISSYLPLLKVGVCQAVGGTLDTIAGDVRRAPALVRALGLEWFYRLPWQPSRLRRHGALVRFAVAVLFAKLWPKPSAAYVAVEPPQKGASCTH